MELKTFQREDESWPPGDQVWWEVSEALAYAVTGVGIPMTLMSLPGILTAWRPGLVLNIGIAGAYPAAGLGIGDIVLARSEVFGDVGFELPEAPGFTSVAEAPFGGSYRKLPMAIPGAFQLSSDGFSFAETDACTVNTCTGTLATGQMRERLFGVGIETMEGAAVALACKAAGVPVCELRAISNIAADRSITPDSIRLALVRLKDYLGACRNREGI
jgi:futalosine hydrolase